MAPEGKRRPEAGRSSLYRAIWSVVRRIPCGRVATYGQIAEMAGHPRQARLVGYALHRLPEHQRAPWHRVVNARGEISTRAPSIVSGAEENLQRLLLEQEGIRFDRSGRIDLARYRWKVRGNRRTRGLWAGRRHDSPKGGPAMRFSTLSHPIRRGRTVTAIFLITSTGLLSVSLPRALEAKRFESKRAGDAGHGLVATFSCVGYDPETGDLGIAVQSKFFAVGAVVPWARAGVGAIATQAFANTTYGPEGLDLLAAGHPAAEAVRILTEADSVRERRQLGVVDAEGRSATFTGTGCMAWAGGIAGTHFAAQGNILAGEEVVLAMADAYRNTAGMLGDRLMAAIEAGQAAGGDSRGMQSAALLIVREGGGYAGFNDRYCDLRVDDAVDPIAELRRIYNLWKPTALILEGYQLVDRGEFERAYAMGGEAVALLPGDGEPRYHLACYHARGGNLEEAISWLAEALRLTPSLAAQASSDTDLTPLRTDPRFIELVTATGK